MTLFNIVENFCIGRNVDILSLNTFFLKIFKKSFTPNFYFAILFSWDVTQKSLQILKIKNDPNSIKSGEINLLIFYHVAEICF